MVSGILQVDSACVLRSFAGFQEGDRVVIKVLVKDDSKAWGGHAVG